MVIAAAVNEKTLTFRKKTRDFEYDMKVFGFLFENFVVFEWKFLFELKVFAIFPMKVSYTN